MPTQPADRARCTAAGAPLNARHRHDGGKPLVARFGGIPLRRRKKAVLVDRAPVPSTIRRKELIRRMAASRCKLREQRAQLEVHRVRRLTDLTPTGRPRPAWMAVMARRRQYGGVTEHATARRVRRQAPPGREGLSCGVLVERRVS